MLRFSISICSQSSRERIWHHRDLKVSSCDEVDMYQVSGARVSSPRVTRHCNARMCCVYTRSVPLRNESFFGRINLLLRGNSSLSTQPTPTPLSFLTLPTKWKLICSWSKISVKPPHRRHDNRLYSSALTCRRINWKQVLVRAWYFSSFLCYFLCLLCFDYVFNLGLLYIYFFFLEIFLFYCIDLK